MTRSVRIGISTCPNDTFAFHALLERQVETPGVELEFELRDVQELNERLRAGLLDVSKVSFAAALHATDEVVVLPAGAALGRGVGPVLLAGAPRLLPAPEETPQPLVLTPGADTTAELLFRLLHPGVGRLERALFSDIPPALLTGRAEFGVCIHEARFTYQKLGLHLVEDTGERYEARTGAALPLGGIVGRRELGGEVLGTVARAVRRSLELARADPQATLPTMRAHAAEQDDAALWAHVELYVTDRTVELGAEGRAALDALARAAREAGLAPPSAAFEVLDA